jgi:hypothetical protein
MRHLLLAIVLACSAVSVLPAQEQPVLLQGRSLLAERGCFLHPTLKRGTVRGICQRLGIAVPF